MKNVLFVSIAAPPKTGAESLQTGKYIKYLSKFHHLYLVTTSPSDSGWKKKDDMLEENIKHLKQLIYIPSFNNRYFQFLINRILPKSLKKPDNDFLFHYYWKFSLEKLNKKPDIIYSRSTPFSSAIMAMKIHKFLKIPWVMHFSDPWFGNPYHKEEANSKYVRDIEKECINLASEITFTSKKTIEVYKNRYPDMQHKFEFMPNVFDNKDLSKPKISFDSKLSFCHTGNFYHSRNPEVLIKAIKTINATHPNLLSNVVFNFAGNMDDYNKQILLENELKCINYIGNLTQAECLKVQRKSNILISIDKIVENEMDIVFFPSKIQDYLAAGKKILAITGKGSATWDFIEGKYGRCFDHSEGNELADYIKTLIEDFKNKKSESFIIRDVPHDYSSEFNAKRLSDIFNKF